MLERLDFWVAMLTLAVLGWLEFNRFVRPIVRAVSKFIRWMWGMLGSRQDAASPSSLTQDTHAMSSMQVVPPGTTNIGTGTAPGTQFLLAQLARDLTEDQLLEVLLLRKRENGDWRFSGKKLFTIWGGSYDAFLKRARAVRGEETAPEDDAVLTPIAGRPTRASYYPDEPDLEFRPLRQ